MIAPLTPDALRESVARIVDPTAFEPWEGWPIGQAAAREKADDIIALVSRQTAEGDTPHCQLCGGEVQGWCCQECPAEFEENDAGKLIIDRDGSYDALRTAPMDRSPE